MSEWKTYKVSELCSDIIDCVNKTAPISTVKTPYRMLRTSDIRNGFINTENLNCVTEEVFEKWTRRGKLQQGDVVFTREAPLGEAAIVRDAENYFLGQRLVLYRANPQVCDNKFLLYAFLNHETKQAIIAKGNGATVLHLRVPECENIEIKAPDIEIQRRIGVILFLYDELIANNQKQIKLLEEAAQRLYKEWFVDLRFPGHEDVAIVDGVPEGWKKQKISEFGDIITGKTPSTSKEQYYGGSIPFVKIPDMHGCVYPITTEATLTTEGANTQKNKFIPKNGIMVSCIATVGLVNIAIEHCQTNQQINSIILNNEQDLYYVYSTMKRLKALLEGVGSNGATMTNVNKTKFGNLEVLYPTEELCKSYFDFCDPIFKKIYSLSVSNNKLVQARERLLPKLMSGEIEV